MNRVSVTTKAVASPAKTVGAKPAIKPSSKSASKEVQPFNVIEAEFKASAHQYSELPPPVHAEVAFAGRSNVGKSSLINALVQRRKLVRTSSTPGCTRGIQLFRTVVRAKEGDWTMDLVDLPGYGFAKRSKRERRSWGPLIEAFLTQRPGLGTVVVIVDIRRGPEDDDLELLEFLHANNLAALVVATKLDKLPGSKRKVAVAALRKSSGLPVIGFSSETQEGRDELWRTLLKSI